MTLEQRIKRIESMIAEIYTVVIERDQTRIDGVDMPAYKRAIRELANGNNKPLELYMKRGGKIPRSQDTAQG